MASPAPELRRALGVPLLVLYGLGVTVGAGIFALIGQISGLAGNHGPLAFLIAGLVAGATGYSYALLASAYPRAGGEAVFVNMGLGTRLAQLAGLGVCLTAIVSSAVITLAFAGYLSALAQLPLWLVVVLAVGVLSALAGWGVRESVLFAAFITILEVGTLLVVIFTGLPFLDADAAARIFSLPEGFAGWQAVLGASFLAFFAFIGFEDIENMAEETHDPELALPRAIFLTLIITTALYALVAAIAASVPGRADLATDPAPLASLFHMTTGLSAKPVAAMAALAMINGILVQIMMGSRLLYGMAREGLVPSVLGVVHPRTQTPLISIGIIGVFIIILALSFPLAGLAEFTSAIILAVFSLVNISLWRIASRPGSTLRHARFWGLLAALLSLGLLVLELAA